MGLGKTVISLALIDWSAGQVKEGVSHKPTLIAAPAVAIGVWKASAPGGDHPIRKEFVHIFPY